MSGFYMLAGTALTDLSLQQLSSLCRQQGLDPEVEEDEFSLHADATLTFREGFDHEVVLVGDASGVEALTRLAVKVSSLLSEQGISHAYEIYDPSNELIEEFASDQ